MPDRSTLRFGSIPVRVEWPFFLVVLLLGGGTMRAWPGNRLVFLVIWVAIVTVSILVHELGHAIAYRANGQHPRITLTAFWGLTEGQRPLPRWRSVVVSLSGVFAAMAVLGIPARLAEDRVYEATGSFEWYLVVYLIGYVNLWWSVANLLPLLPLDGGQVARELWGLRTARIAALVCGVPVAIWLFVTDHTYAAFLVAMLVLLNFAEATREGFIGSGGATFVPGGRDIGRPPERSEPTRHRGRRKRGRHGRRSPDLRIVEPPPSGPKPRAVDPRRLEAAAWDALRAGDPAEAEGLLLEATGRGGVSPYLSASIAASQGRHEDAVRLFASAFRTLDTSPNLLVARIIADADIAVPVAEDLLAGGHVDAAAELQNHLHFAGAYREAALVGERLAADDRRSVAQSSYETACAWAKAGDPDAGLVWLDRAVEAGFRAPSIIDREDDLAEVRTLPGYAALRARLSDG